MRTALRDKTIKETVYVSDDGVEFLNIHDCESHEVEYHGLKNGMPIEMVSRMLGHSNISTTQIYLDLNDEQMKIMHSRYVR